MWLLWKTFWLVSFFLSFYAQTIIHKLVQQSLCWIMECCRCSFLVAHHKLSGPKWNQKLLTSSTEKIWCHMRLIVWEGSNFTHLFDLCIRFLFIVFYMLKQDIAFMWGSNLSEALLIFSYVYVKSSILAIFSRIITGVLKICLIKVLIYFECLKNYYYLR